jgi:hypothetical protein
MLRRIIRWAAVLLVGGIFVLPPSLALTEEQPGAQPKPPDQAQSAKPNGKAEGDQKAADQAKEKAESEAVEEYKKAATMLPGAAGAPECVWTGRRIASLLWRDDIDTARRYIDLYDRFGCPSEHLKLVFRCVIRQGPIDPKAADRLASRVFGCWIAPQEPNTASTQATTDSAPKSGTIPN